MKKKHLMSFTAISIIMIIGLGSLAAEGTQEIPETEFLDYTAWEDVYLDSLEDMSVESLRSRNYGSRVSLVEILGTEGGANEYQQFYSEDGTASYSTYIAAYNSDGNRVYSRIDVPAGAVPENGYPVVMFVHGWVGAANAPEYALNYSADAYYGDIIDSYVDAGFLVCTPAFRGHSTVDGIPGEGHDFLTVYDNGSYVSPLFYAIDVLNLIDGLDTLERNDWSIWSTVKDKAVKVNTDEIHIAGHSQGGDAVLTALAVSGEGSSLDNEIKTGSIWSGCFPERITQVETYSPMGESAEAFKAGNQEEFIWNGTAVGPDGSVNPNFVFGWAPDWIGTVNPENWGWQADYFGKSVESMLKKKYDQMYSTYNTYVEDMQNHSYTMTIAENGKVQVENDTEVLDLTRAMSAFNYPEWLTDEKIILQHSDQDYYSLPIWNADLSRRITEAGGECLDYIYPENTHSLTQSSHEWFDSDGSAVPGRKYAIKRDLLLFSGDDPEAVVFP